MMTKYTLISIILIILLAIFLFRIGIIKEGSIRNPITNETWSFTDNCPNKFIEGQYYLSLVFAEPDSNQYVKNNTEMYYTLNLSKQNCDVLGKGIKTSDSYKIKTQKRQYHKYKNLKIKFDETLKGDTLTGLIRFDTISNNDSRVKLILISKLTGPNTWDGHFIDSVTEGKGLAKMSKE